MNHINKLKDIGRNRSCLIIGGGHSVNDIDLPNISDDIYIIAINDHHYSIADMIIYYDRDMQEYYRDKHIKTSQLLVGFKHRESIDYTVPACTHSYSYEDIIFGDSGFHALQFADNIFNFKDIYLAGYDYDIKGESYHYDEEKSNKVKLDRFKNWSIGNVLDKYASIPWKNNIYNLNKASKLNIFNFSLPIDLLS